MLKITIKFIAAYALVMGANSIFAQSSTPYAGQQTRSIKALSDVIDAERKLDSESANKSITPELLASTTRRIGEMQVQIRDSHLQTHLKQTALRNDEQIAAYASLRGY